MRIFLLFELPSGMFIFFLAIVKAKKEIFPNEFFNITFSNGFFFRISIFAIVEKIASVLSLVINSIVTVLEDRDFILGFILLTVEKEMLQFSGY